MRVRRPVFIIIAMGVLFTSCTTGKDMRVFIDDTCEQASSAGYDLPVTLEELEVIKARKWSNCADYIERENLIRPTE